MSTPSPTSEFSDYEITTPSNMSSTDTSTTSNEAVGIAASSFARSSGELIGLINDLRSSGAALELDVPRVAVIGNQSAGKSSLVEAISGVSC